MTRERLSTLAVLPDDVTDPLLWRLALDVAAAHQTNEEGNCRNLQCADELGICSAARNARRAMTPARRPRPVVATPTRTPDHRRVVGSVHAPTPFRGWFTSTNSQAVTSGRAWLAGITVSAA